MKPIDMILFCPACHAQHIDAPEPDKGWDNPPHKSHLCHQCGVVWRPADVSTNGVESIATRGELDTWFRPGERVELTEEALRMSPRSSGTATVLSTCKGGKRILVMRDGYKFFENWPASRCKRIAVDHAVQG